MADEERKVAENADAEKKKVKRFKKKLLLLR